MGDHNACAIAMDKNGTLFIAVHSPLSKLGYTWIHLPTIGAKAIDQEIVRNCDLLWIEFEDWMADFYLADEWELANFLEEMEYA